MSNYLVWEVLKYFDEILRFDEVIEISLGGNFLPYPVDYKQNRAQNTSLWNPSENFNKLQPVN